MGVMTADQERDQTPVSQTLGRYVLRERLGEGGMGVVYRATPNSGQSENDQWEDLPRDAADGVAIKVLRPHIAHDPDARRRLEREVDVLSRVHHPHVAAVLDADVDGPAPYVVTEYVPGVPLDALVSERGPLPPKALVRLGRGLYEALRAIHRQGIVHRDLKPGNVMMVDGEPVVIDFGIAQVADDARLTMTGMVMGTPGYLSPEVVEGSAVTEATDWWGWAATLAFAASGRAPFGGGPMAAVLDRVTRGRSDLSAVDPELAPLLAAALEPDPSARPPAEEVIAALQAYAEHRPVTTALTQRTPRIAPQQHAGQGSPPRTVYPGGPAADQTRAFAVSETRVQPRQAPPGRVPHAPPPQGRPYRSAREWEVDGGPQQAGGAHLWGPGQRAEAQQNLDPRIGQQPRTGTLASLLALFLGLCALVPLVGWFALGVWSVLARTSDRMVTAMVMRRHEAGYRKTDTAVAVASAPWHVLRALLSSILALLLPAAFALAATVITAAGLTTSGLLDVDINHPLPLALGSFLGAVIAWWGPGGVSLRRGSRTVVRRAVPTPGPARAFGIVLTCAGLAMIALAVYTASPVSWWPVGPHAPFEPLIPEILQP